MDNWKNMWDSRYRQEGYAYGEHPNEYLKEQLAHLPTGSILFGAEGEGRNAIHAAKSGWEVSAFDISEEGKNKALLLAQKNKVTIDYRVGQLPQLNYTPEQFDAIALIYAHFPPDIRSAYHQLLATYLKQGGLIIIEAFGKNHIEYRQKNEKVGGPNKLAMLFSTDELRAAFEGFEIITLEETAVELNEGLYHNGVGSVVRFVGRKK
jgi:cyclopropane fatty-acyl-phospholipid synthase-like methyltransferase